MKEIHDKFSKFFDEYAKTRNFKWFRSLITALCVVVTGCVSFLAGFFLNRDDNMIYKSNINAIANAAVTLPEQTTCVTTVPEETAPPETTTTRFNVNGITLNSIIEENFNPENIEHQYKNTCSFEKRASIGDINIPMIRKTVYLEYSGTITAGIDKNLIKLTADNDRRILTVVIPEAYIISHEISKDSFVLSDTDKYSHNSGKTEDYLTLCKAQNEDMELTAIENGLFEKVYESVRQNISLILGSDKRITENFAIDFVISKS